MYSKEQASKIRQKFWTSFGQYMKPVPGADGAQTNWLNYKTGVKHISFRMDADKYTAYIGIEISHSKETERLDCYQQFIDLKKLLENTTGFKWQWNKGGENKNGQVISNISQAMENVNVLNEADWPAMIAFLKSRIISLDAFWHLVKDGFE